MNIHILVIIQDPTINDNDHDDDTDDDDDDDDDDDNDDDDGDDDDDDDTVNFACCIAIASIKISGVAGGEVRAPRY